MKKIVTLILVSQLACVSAGWYMGENYDLQNPVVSADLQLNQEMPEIQKVTEHFPNDKEQFEMIVSNVYSEDVLEIPAKPIK